jgi:hypothetical protein
MDLILNNELTYELQYAPEDTPVDFNLRDWPYLVPVLQASCAKIVSAEQRGIYGNDHRRFAVVTSAPLEESEVTDILNAWTTFDPTAIKAEERSIKIEMLRLDQGKIVKAYMGYLCEVAELTSEDYLDMLADQTLFLLDRLLLSGALESSFGLLSSYTPTTYFTQEFKVSMLNKLQESINTVNAYIALN